uniref:Uncharacterized protein n=1 Tax=Timema monikensis TaxID=170555 RepID=A0A7R9EGG7_9NEOP|nr:unnamed protein product [Timema monikensis]
MDPLMAWQTVDPVALSRNRPLAKKTSCVAASATVRKRIASTQRPRESEISSTTMTMGTPCTFSFSSSFISSPIGWTKFCRKYLPQDPPPKSSNKECSLNQDYIMNSPGVMTRSQLKRLDKIIPRRVNYNESDVPDSTSQDGTASTSQESPPLKKIKASVENCRLVHHAKQRSGSDSSSAPEDVPFEIGLKRALTAIKNAKEGIQHDNLRKKQQRKEKLDRFKQQKEEKLNRLKESLACKEDASCSSSESCETTYEQDGFIVTSINKKKKKKRVKASTPKGWGEEQEDQDSNLTLFQESKATAEYSR